MELVRKAVAGLVAALLLTSCTTTSSNNTAFVSGDGTTTVLAKSSRGIPLELTGETLAGEKFDVAEYRGKNVVINVWASWCAPCRQEAPELKTFSIENSNVQVLVNFA